MLVRNSLVKQIVETIEANIRDETYKIGDKLPPEPELMKLFNVSRNTVREAVQALTFAGILEARQGDGTYVIENERLKVDFFNFLSDINSKDVVEVRNMLEENIVTMAVKNADKKDILNIENCLDNRKKSANIVKENTKADLDFHISIAKATHNPLMIQIYEYISNYLGKIIESSICSNHENQREIDDLHDALFMAIKSKEVEKSKNIIKEIVNYN